MCCRSEVRPLDRAIAEAILRVGQFEEKTPGYWVRAVPEEGCSVVVNLGGIFEASIQPSISTYDHHHGKRITGGIYFEICAKYAEKVGGEIIQKATVSGCKPADTPIASLVIAQYPDKPLMWERVCRGFQEEILGWRSTKA